MLHEDSALDLMVVVVDNSYFSYGRRREVSKARAEWIRAWLIRQGIEPTRIDAYGEQCLPNLPRTIRDHFRVDGTQQVILVPLAGSFQ